MPIKVKVYINFSILIIIASYFIAMTYIPVTINSVTGNQTMNEFTPWDNSYVTQYDY